MYSIKIQRVFASDLSYLQHAFYTSDLENMEEKIKEFLYESRDEWDYGTYGYEVEENEIDPSTITKGSWIVEYRDGEVII